ncbi:MAG: translocation/assembly module TamB domain-containing protein [Bryobacteraceae bacterium]
MSKRKKILLTIAGSLAGLVVVVIVAAILVLQSAWFANFVRGKIVEVTEESTGGVAELQSFEFDWTHLTARIRNFVLHGNEPKGSDPLARVALLEVRLKLFSGLKKAVDIRYLGIERPQINLIVFPDGTTNIPQPKVKKKSTNETSGLETVVNLAVGQFNVQDGLLQFAQQKTAFSARGENLRILLDYNQLNPSYQGKLTIDPLLITGGPNATPLPVHVSVPITLQRDAIQVSDVKVTTEESQITLNASLQNMKAPKISARLNLAVSMPEMQRSFALPMHLGSRLAPKRMNAEASVRIDSNANVVQIESAHLGLGATTFQASGTLEPGKTSAVAFNSNFALNELASLFAVSGVQTSGALEANGTARLDAQNNYAVDGHINSRGLSIQSGTTRLTDISLYSPFHADPFLLSLDGLRLNVAGGALWAKVFLEKMQNLSVEGALRNFSLPVLVSSVIGKPIGYDGSMQGSLRARADLKAKGTSGYTAETNLTIVPGVRGVPVSGRLNVKYNGPHDTVDLGDSFIALPHSRVTMAGTLNRELDIDLNSRNLADFLPAANFGAAKPVDSLPVELQGGALSLRAQVKGKLSAPQVVGHLGLDHFAVEGRSFDQLGLNLAASEINAAVTDGVLARGRLRTGFDANIALKKWTPVAQSPLTANLSLRNGDVADLLALAGQANIPASGELNGDVHINGTYGNPLGNANLQVMNASAYQQPIDHVLVNATLADQLITLNRFEVAAGGGTLAANGTFQHPPDSFATGRAQVHVATNNVQLANLVALQKRSPGTAGLIQLSADARGDLTKSGEQTQFVIRNVTADFKAGALRLQNQNAGDLTATARTAGQDVTYQVRSDFAGSNVSVDGRTTLAANYPTVADAHIQNLAVQKALQIVGQGAVPVAGELSAEAHVAGTMQTPDANLQFQFARASVYGEPLDRLSGSVHYANTAVQIPSIQLDVPAGRVTLNGSYSHPVGDLNSGALTLKVDSSELQLAKVHHVMQAKPGLAGTLQIAANLSANVRERNGRRELLFSQLDANVAAKRLRVNEANLGQAEFTAKSTGQNVSFQLNSDLAKSEVRLAGTSQLAGDYQTQATLTFGNIHYSNLAPFIEGDPAVRPAFDAVVEGKASLNGPLLRTDALTARLQLDQLQFVTRPKGSPTGAPATRSVDLHNEGPIVIALNHSNIAVEHFQITGPGTSIKASGGLNMAESRSPLSLNVDANADLKVLQDVSRDFYSSGNLAMNAVIRGTTSNPLVNGRVELRNATVNYADSPNGISNANGVILLNGTNATIQNLTGESGGGKIALTGFVGYTGNSMNFNLEASANKVRVRYSGISVTGDADISLIGNTRRSLVSGTVTVQRIAYGSSSDAGSFLSTASTPPSVPSAPSPLLAAMRLELRILTAPDVRVVTTYADRLSIEANLAVRGTAISPGMLGRVTVTDGELVFFGNKYTVNTGTVNFYNPNAIQPVLNVSLETIAQNVDVVLGVAGPINNLQLSYRSDPPLTFSQIVSLLATNTTPNDPTIAAHQPTPPQQSFSQMGQSAILGQAVANPLASRVQRVFGLSALKIDPSVAGSNGQPTAKVTLQQKIASNITFTYITDVTQTNSQIIRIEWAITPKFSGVGLRDYNGNVSVQMFYKFKVR